MTGLIKLIGTTTLIKLNGIITLIKLNGVMKKMGTILVPDTENFRGSDCSGTNGTASRTLTLTNTNATYSGSDNVIVGGRPLHDPEYSIVHNSNSSVITFNNPIWDDDYIKVMYMRS